MSRASLLFFVACLACSGPDAGDAGAAVGPGPEDARAFFERLGDEPVRLTRGDVGTETELAIYDWIRGSAARSGFPAPTGFVVRSLDPRSTDSYAYRLHLRRGHPELSAGKRYVEVQLLHAASDPEIHGIIDVDEMLLVSINEDGGA